MFAEERFLEGKFGEEYMNWSQKVPAFIPCFKNYRKSETPFSPVSVLRREYSGFLATVFSFAFIDYLRYFFIHDKIDIYRTSTYVLIIALIITIILRTLKHNTRLLNEEGRS